VGTKQGEGWQAVEETSDGYGIKRAWSDKRETRGAEVQRKQEASRTKRASREGPERSGVGSELSEVHGTFLSRSRISLRGSKCPWMLGVIDSTIAHDRTAAVISS
jgi:hypothetical protein